MKQFLYKLTMFFLPVFAILCFMEVFLRIIPNDYKYKKVQLLNEANDIQILVLGSSHALNGIDPSYLPLSGFNLANGSQSLDLDYKLLEKYGEKLPQLKYVIIPISYRTMFYSMGSGSEPWRFKNYILYYDIKPDNSKITNYFELLNGRMSLNISRIFNYIIKKSNVITVSNNGSELKPSYIKNDLEKSGRSTALRHTISNELFADNKDIMERIIEWCEQRDVKLVLITPPAYYTYRNNIDQTQLNEAINYMKNIDTNHDNIYYYNLFDEESFTDEHYSDADHLNETGAKKLTLLLNDIITQIEQ